MAKVFAGWPVTRVSGSLKLEQYSIRLWSVVDCLGRPSPMNVFKLSLCKLQYPAYS